jgi:hypothetical protein
MAIFIDGFEQFNGDRTAALMRMAGYQVGAVSIVAGRKGTSRAISCYRSSFSREWQLSTNITTVGFAVKFDARGPLASISVAANKLYVWVDRTTGLVNMGTSLDQANPGYANPLLNRWYYVELQVDVSGGLVTLFINGKADSSVAVPNFLTGTVVVTLNPWDLMTDPQDFGTRLFDDLYITDSARLEPIQVTTRSPTADGSKTDWSFAGATSRWAAVAPPINELDKFIFTAVDGAQNTFISAAAMPDSNPIRFLQLITMFRKATSDPMSIDFNIDNQVVREANIARTWTFRYTMFSASGYDTGNISSAQFGAKMILG